MIRLLVSRNGHAMIREVGLQRRVADELMAEPRVYTTLQVSRTCRHMSFELDR